MKGGSRSVQVLRVCTHMRDYLKYAHYCIFYPQRRNFILQIKKTLSTPEQTIRQRSTHHVNHFTGSTLSDKEHQSFRESKQPWKDLRLQSTRFAASTLSDSTEALCSSTTERLH